MSLILNVFKKSKSKENKRNASEMRDVILPSFLNKYWNTIPKHVSSLKSNKLGLNNGKWGIIIENVYTSNECNDLIKISEEMGFPLIFKKKDDIRINERIMCDSKIIANDMFNRVKQFIPKKYKYHKLIGLNERLRILRYKNGHEFNAHFDGEYRRKNGERSYITFILYLNDSNKCFNDTGLTIFYNGNTSIEYKEGISHVSIKPKQGMVILFEHNILHRGTKIKGNGTKYIMRTDVMYSNKIYL